MNLYSSILLLCRLFSENGDNSECLPSLIFIIARRVEAGSYFMQEGDSVACRVSTRFLET